MRPCVDNLGRQRSTRRTAWLLMWGNGIHAFGRAQDPVWPLLRPLHDWMCSRNSLEAAEGSRTLTRIRAACSAVASEIGQILHRRSRMRKTHGTRVLYRFQSPKGQNYIGYCVWRTACSSPEKAA